MTEGCDHPLRNLAWRHSSDSSRLDRLIGKAGLLKVFDMFRRERKGHRLSPSFVFFQDSKSESAMNSSSSATAAGMSCISLPSISSIITSRSRCFFIADFLENNYGGLFELKDFAKGSECRRSDWEFRLEV